MNRLCAFAASAAVIAPTFIGMANVSATEPNLSLTGITLGASSVDVAIWEQKSVSVTFAPTDFAYSNEKVSIDCEPKDSSVSPIASCFFDSTEGNIVIYGGNTKNSQQYSVTAKVFETSERTGEPVSSASADLMINNTGKLASDGDDSHYTDGYEGMVQFKTPIDGATSIKIEKIDTPESAKKVEKDLIATFNVSAVDAANKTVSVSNNEVTIMLGLDPAVFGNYQKFQLVFINEAGEITEWFDPTEITTEPYSGWINIFFKTSHLSSYGVLASNTAFTSADDKNALYRHNHKTSEDTSASSTVGTPNSGVSTKEAGSAATSTLAGLIASTMLISLAYLGKKHLAKKTA
ncbi:hypothetical protein IK112_02610 [Candidatus Saccharibacteria bacterium]|nr:hypothetical protein [Candidatus Saccharibacteria bacterium]